MVFHVAGFRMGLSEFNKGTKTSIGRGWLMEFEKITFKTADGKAYHLEIDHLHPNILTAGSPGRIHKLVKYLDEVEVIEGDRKMTVVNGKYKGLPVSAFATGMGPASTAVVLPEALELAEGPVTMLRLGTSGSLQPFVKVGHMVINSGVVRDEMATRAAVGPEYPAVADPELVPIMVAAAEKHGYGLGEKLWVGIIHAKDDLYFVETPQFSPSTEFMTAKLSSYRRMGVLASEMEFSVYCIMRDFYEGRKGDRILVGNLLAVIASAPEEEAVAVSKEDKKRMEKDLIEIGLDTLLMVNQLRSGEDITADLNQVIRKMMQVPPRSKLL
jgi:uridine phosphorylase